jgi:tetratricopeptide (TPR) repeat protein
MPLSARYAFLAAALLIALPLHADGASPSAQATADDLFARSQWDKAAQAYSEIVSKEPANGMAWENLGECELQLHQYSNAIQAFTRSAEQKFRPLVNQVNISRAYAAQGQRSDAMRILGEVSASGQGSRVRSMIATATEFQAFKDDPQFKQILERIAPCRTPEYRQFDFWIGDWEVQDPAGQIVGHNLVTLEQSGCLIVEHWTGAGGAETGASFNYYDIRDSKWHQLYLDNSGNAGAFPAMAGSLMGERMVLVTDETKNPVHRWTWYSLAPGRVRQMGEQSSDGQKTWQVSWDAVYVNKKVNSTK